MIHDDWLLRQFAELATALAGAKKDLAEQQLEAAGDGLDRLARDSVGMSLGTLDRLPLVAVIGATSALDEKRRRGLAAILDVAAELADAEGKPTVAADRRVKSAAI